MRVLTDAPAGPAHLVATRALPMASKTAEGSGGASIAGSGGAAGNSGDAGAGGEVRDSSTDTSTENCFDGQDNDGDHAPDCADPDCAQVATCVPDPGDFTLGVRTATPSTACPADFANPVTLATADTRAALCNTAGCACNPNLVCEPLTVLGWYCPWKSGETSDQHNQRCQSACTTMSLPTAFYSIDAPTPHGTQSCSDLTPGASDPSEAYDPWGFTVGGGVKSKTCTPSGTPTLPSLALSREARFCAGSKRSAAGCAVGKVCVPKTTAAVRAYATGTRPCPAGFGTADTNWYTNYSQGTRTCTACSCGPAIGGSCATTAIFGTDSFCGTDGVDNRSSLNVTVNQMKCVSSLTHLHNPNVRFKGQSNPTCPPQSSVTGSPQGVGQHTVCCL